MTKKKAAPKRKAKSTAKKALPAAFLKNMGKGKKTGAKAASKPPWVKK